MGSFFLPQLVLIRNKSLMLGLGLESGQCILLGCASFVKGMLTCSSDFGDEYPSATITGTDLSPIQPTWVPPNVKFEIDDAQTEWTWDDNWFDFVHIRCLMGSIKDWHHLYSEAFRQAHPLSTRLVELLGSGLCQTNSIKLHEARRLHRAPRI